MRGLTTIAFDADDTLWHSERVFKLTEQRFAALLADHVESDGLSQRLLETEKRNLQYYGFGRKGFVLSMIETAIDVTDGKVPTAILKDLIDLGRDMAAHPIEILPDVRETLEAAAERYRILLITKATCWTRSRSWRAPASASCSTPWRSSATSRHPPTGASSPATATGRSAA
jgi:putative hydrolase of the HAD superfamily